MQEGGKPGFFNRAIEVLDANKGQAQYQIMEIRDAHYLKRIAFGTYHRTPFSTRILFGTLLIVCVWTANADCTGSEPFMLGQAFFNSILVATPASAQKAIRLEIMNTKELRVLDPRLDLECLNRILAFNRNLSLSQNHPQRCASHIYSLFAIKFTNTEDPFNIINIIKLRY
jgi:hypothetical protein